MVASSAAPALGAAVRMPQSKRWLLLGRWTSVKSLGSRSRHLRLDRARENWCVDPGCPLGEEDPPRRSIIPMEGERRSLAGTRHIRREGGERAPGLKKGQLHQLPLRLSFDVHRRDGLPWDQKVAAAREIEAKPAGFEGQAAERVASDEIPDGCG